jgi:phosphomannomutase
MHGVSHSFLTRGLKAFGFSADVLIPVLEQRDPDPDFPTVIFPNPEEKGEVLISSSRQLGEYRFLYNRGTREFFLF